MDLYLREGVSGECMVKAWMIKVLWIGKMSLGAEGLRQGEVTYPLVGVV